MLSVDAMTEVKTVTDLTRPVPETRVQWFLLYSQPRKEVLASEHLTRQGYHICVPKLRLPKLRRAHWQQVVEPLFPRYLFVAVQEGIQAFQPLHSTRGISRVVRFGQDYARVSPALIAAMQHGGDAEGVHEFRETPFEAGERVRVMAGPFKDLEGVFERASGQERVHVLLDVLGAANRVTLEAGLIVPMATRCGGARDR